jgi:hypothetical protein
MYLLNFYASTISSLSNSSSNFFKSTFQSISFLRNSIKSNGGLHLILRSLNQFLLKKINFFKFSICQQHFLRLVRISTKENIFSVFIWHPTIPKIYQAKTPIVGNIASYFYHNWRGHLMSLTSNWYLLKINSPLLISFFVNSHVLAICLNIFKL